MESKWDKNGRRIILEYLGFFGGRINAKRCPGWPQDRGRTLDSPGPPVRRLMLFFFRKKANFMRKIWAKDSPQSELRISEYKRNGERAEYGNAETERDTEIDPISEGLSPLPCHGSQGPEGKPFSHLGRRSRKKKKKGGGALSPLLSVAPERRRGPSSSPRSTPTTSPSSSPTLPPSMQWCNLSFTRCNLYLNMVLPKMYGYPMMFE